MAYLTQSGNPSHPYYGINAWDCPMDYPLVHTRTSHKQSGPFHGPYYGVHGIVQWTTLLVHTSTSLNPAIHPIPWSILWNTWDCPMDYPHCQHQYLTQSGNPSHSIVRTMKYVGLSNGLPSLPTPVPHTIRQSVPFYELYTVLTHATNVTT